MTLMANPIIIATVQHGTVVAGFLYVLLLLYLSLSLSILIPQKLAYYLTFSPDNRLGMSVLNSSYDSFIGIMGFRTVKF